MDSFTEYLELLLLAPLRREKQAINAFVAFCRFAGTLFDEAMEQLHFAREQTRILSCAPEMLPEHGRIRNAPQLKGESSSAYRSRLVNQFDIARLSGTTNGIKLAIQSLGYRNITLEAVRKTDPTRWAEFYVWISDKVEPVPIDIALLHSQVSRVKNGTSRAVYGLMPSAAGMQAIACASVGIYYTIEPYTPEDIESEADVAFAATTTAAVIFTIEPKEE